VFVAVRHFLHPARPKKPEPMTADQRAVRFWSVVASIELTDIAFAADSILASIALVGPMPPGSTIHPKLWLILLGGMLGVLIMRVAAVVFIRLLRKFPRFETTAYLLVTTVGVKLLVDWWYNADGDRLDFQSPASAAFWVFWSTMILCIAVGFLPGRKPVP
jgi:YkoY family integral membrane protein